MSRTLTHLLLAFSVLLAADRAAGSEQTASQPTLLRSVSCRISGGGWPPTLPAFQIVLSHRSRDAADVENARMGDGLWWHNGDSGTIDFVPADNYGFDQVTPYFTDGEDDLLFALRSKTSSGGSGGGGSESEFFGQTPDLAGYAIDLIRLSVWEVIIENRSSPWGTPIQWEEFSATYEFWGHSIPEPASLFLFSLPALRICRRARR